VKRLNLLNTDLNLLVAFDALVVEGNVSRAASRIGVSQPAMSRSLRHLREIFGDVLFRRTSDGMIPTPHALRLAQAIRPSLENIAAAIGQQTGFDPATATRCFTLAMPDMAARLTLPAVTRIVNQQAPGIDVAILNTGNHGSLSKVESGQAELGIGVYEHLPATVRSMNLRRLREVCVGDPENQMLRKRVLSVETFLSLPHVAVTMAGDFGTPVDTVLETLGLKRRIAVRTPFFDCIPALVRGTNLVAVLVEDLLDASPEGKMLIRHPVPLPLEPVMSKMIWHARTDDDVGHRWLRDIFLATADNYTKNEYP
jgi:LysR family transcriptional activator of mexEF-oprN operon